MNARRPSTQALPVAPDSSARRAALGPLLLGAIGVVFGDIGTSPLYAMETVFSIDHNVVAPSADDVYGIISLVVWSIMVVVSTKYVALVMRADNEGEGGILALVHLLRDKLERGRLTRAVLILGIIGAGLFYGDSVITPAISVMSAIEGLEAVTPSAASLVVPVSIAILAGLFAIQRWGTSVVGRAFGPVMVVWFAILAILGLPHIIAHPQILAALSPHHALLFVVSRPFIAFISLGAVVLTITGAEALYADMGHFGARPIKLAWFFFVLPALTLDYLGQGALILSDPSAAADPFFAMAPSWARIPLVALATLATIIASQAVISGAFTVLRQATRLGVLPRLKVVQTSREEGGQIYVPAINGILFVGVVALILAFRSSTALADAYGLAVTGTLILTSLLFLLLARKVWGIAAWKVVVYALTEAIEFNRVLHQHVIILSMINEPTPHVAHCKPIEVVPLEPECPGVTRIRCRIGFNDSQDAPKVIALALEQLDGYDGLAEADARYFLPAFQIQVAEGGSRRLIRRIYAWMAHNAADGAVALHLPQDRTFLVGRTVEI